MSSVKMVFIMFLAVILVSIISGSVLAEANPEERFLTGTVTSVNNRSKHVVVDLQNKGCQGARTFAVMKSDIVKLSPGKRIQFYSNSAGCPGTEVRRITKVWSVK